MPLQVTTSIIRTRYIEVGAPMTMTPVTEGGPFIETRVVLRIDMPTNTPLPAPSTSS